MKNITKEIINSLLAGLLVFFGAFADGNITYTGIIAAVSASAVVALNKFKDWWKSEEGEYAVKVLTFI